MSLLKCICISVDSAHGSLQATARDKLVTVTLCVFVSIEFACVCVFSVTEAPYWLLMVESPQSEW